MWTQKTTLALIEDIRLNPCLWNKEYKDCDDFKIRGKSKRTAVYKELGAKYGVSAKEIDLKFQALKNQFRREHRRIEKYENGLSPKQIHWFGYEPLIFLLNNCVNPSSQMKREIYEQTQDVDENSDTEYTEYLEYEMADEPKMPQPITFRTVQSSQNSAATASEAFKCMRTLAEKICSRDEYDVYGEYIANKLRECGRSPKEVAIAQHEINTICFKLCMGELGHNVDGSLQDSVHSNPEVEQEFECGGYNEKGTGV